MIHKHDLKSLTIPVFISSSMEDELQKERRAAIYSFFERWPIYHCKIIEATAHPDSVETRYQELVLQSDIFILILAGTLRPAVRQEFQIALQANKRMFVFIHGQITDINLTNFIQEEIGTTITRHTFNNLNELINKIEESLLDDLAVSYKNWMDYEKQKRKPYKDEL